jgi:hypothetical protein
MSVPEATMYKDNLPSLGEHQIGLAGQFRIMSSIPESKPMEGFS